MTHSPAPWVVSTDDGLFGGYHIDDEFADLEDSGDPALEEVLARKEANARLMASAPELADGCAAAQEFLQRVIDGEPWPSENARLVDLMVLMGVLESAIAKARGQS